MAKKRKPPRRARTAQDDAFLADVVEHPEDDAPRLVYADWLIEHGDEADRDRAEFIRVQCALARGDPEEAKRNELAAREGVLLQMYEKEWLAALPEGVGGLGTVYFERGFPGLLATGCADFPRLAELLRPVAPITAVYVIGEGGWMSGDDEYADVGTHLDDVVGIFAATPQLSRVRSLTITESGLHGRHVKALLSSPHLTGLRHLDLSSNALGRGSFGPSGARAVAEAACLAGVTYLDLSGNDVGNAGAVALAASPRLAKLTTLLLSYNGIGEEGGLALAASPHLERLQLLDLSGEPLSAAARTALHGRFGSRVKL
jgi:uncharacterized protein (TIGR02996 family)